MLYKGIITSMLNINESRLLFLFRKLVETDSSSGKERKICDIIKNELSNLGYESNEDNAGKYIKGNSGNLYAYIDGDIALPSILFSAHMDTVEPSENKKFIIDQDGTIHSDGTTVLGADDFSGVSAILEALNIIKENNISHRPIELLFSVSEENYCRGISKFDFNKLKSKEAYVFDLSGNVGYAAYAAPTIISFKAEIIGISSHAGFAPEKGVNAIKAAAYAISAIQCGKIDDDTTVNIGKISGGTADNIVPDKCIITGEIRSYSDEKAIKQYNLIKDIFEKTASQFDAETEITHNQNITAYETELNHSVVKRFNTVCSNLQIEPKLIRSFGGSDNNVMSQNGVAGIVIATAMNNCHSTNEWTTIDELKRAVNVALELMISKE